MLQANESFWLVSEQFVSLASCFNLIYLCHSGYTFHGYRTQLRQEKRDKPSHHELRYDLESFPPFWNPFNFVRDLLKAFFPINPIAGCHITPKKMIDILKNAAKHMDAIVMEPSALSPDPGDSDVASYNQNFHETTSHTHLSPPQKRARVDATGGH